LKTVIFGGAGFVGLNLAEALAERGNEALLFDRAP
jgi:UDP-glucose 4-epimerase